LFATGPSRLRPALLIVAVCMAAAMSPVRGDVAGDRFCVACHAEVADALTHGAHAAVLAVSEQTAICESCHGEGRSHALSMKASNIVIPQQADPAEVPDACLPCHANPANERHALRKTCLVCHVFHAGVAASP